VLVSSEQQYEEFLSLFARDRERLFRYIFALLPNHADAEDVFQRCSLVLWRKFSEFDSERNFFSWACGVALYEVRNFLRSSHHRHMTFNSELVTQLSDYRLTELETSQDALKHLTSCLEHLSRPDRQLVDVAYGESETLKEFAESTGQVLQTLYNKLGRLRRQLLDCIRKKMAAEVMP